MALLLLTPANAAGAFPDDDGAVDFTHVDTLQAVRVRPEASSKGGAQYSVDVSHLLHEGRARVCQGTLSVDGHRQGEVVCKIGCGSQVVERIRKEADLYRGKLAPLQGRYVPTFVGLFEGETEDGETACLVLTHEGERMQQSLYISGIDLRKRVMDALVAVHQAGVRHSDFGEHSIVIRKDNTPVLVGFGGAEDHDCHLGIDIRFYQPQPHNQAVACEEVYWACVVAAVWLPATVEFLNSPVPIQWALEGSDSLVAHAPKGTDPDLARMHAELTREDLLEWIEERELYDGQPLPIKMRD
ncbi:hypothetical protein OH76DRAFT_1402601 [Lentinus brumalis]|uniref:Protein kinase domain-containing protein n=1 Tax=Lentinus brumalis TaxID=2498619 RepID=A0A371DDJ8_9APHY|nr:hypothetical protein OH76DRAFT_1402601 [Polyporus brumalis]